MAYPLIGIRKLIQKTGRYSALGTLQVRPWTASLSLHGQIGRTAKFAQPKAAHRVNYMDVVNDVFMASQEAGTP